jgi:hypothetical protein
MSIKNSNDTIRNQSLNLPVCSAVAQPRRHRVSPIGFEVSFLLWKLHQKKNSTNINFSVLFNGRNSSGTFIPPKLRFEVPFL